MCMMCANLHLTNGNEILFLIWSITLCHRDQGFRHAFTRKQKFCVGQKPVRKLAKLHQGSFYIWPNGQRGTKEILFCFLPLVANNEDFLLLAFLVVVVSRNLECYYVILSHTFHGQPLHKNLFLRVSVFSYNLSP